VGSQWDSVETIDNPLISDVAPELYSYVEMLLGVRPATLECETVATLAWCVMQCTRSSVFGTVSLVAVLQRPAAQCIDRLAAVHA
jgi:hypothetical protein